MKIISTRIFEALGAGALGIFSEDSNANVLFRNKKHYIEFDDVENFIYSIYQIKDIKNELYFQKIARDGKDEAHSKHNWGSRIVCFLKEINA